MTYKVISIMLSFNLVFILVSCESVTYMVPKKSSLLTSSKSKVETAKKEKKSQNGSRKLFISKDLAAIEACELALKNTKKWWKTEDNRAWKKQNKGVEFFGYICKSKDGMYGYTPPKKGVHPEHLDADCHGQTGFISRAGGNEASRAYFGQHSEVVGCYHSHIRPFSRFSESDAYTTNLTQLTGYLSTQGGAIGGARVFKMEPVKNYTKNKATNTIIEISTPSQRLLEKVKTGLKTKKSSD